MNLDGLLKDAQIDAILMLISELTSLVNTAGSNATQALSLNNSAILGTGTGNNQSLNYSTLFGNSQDTAVPAKSLSFLFGAKGFLGYVNDATGAMYTDTNVTLDPQGLGQYEVVNYRTLVRMVNAISQPVDLVWSSDKIAFGLDIVNNKTTIHSYTPYNSELLSNGIYSTKLIGVNSPVEFAQNDVSFQSLYTATQLASITNYNGQVSMPTPTKYELYLEVLYLSNIVRIPVSSINYMLYVDSDGDLSIIINSNGLINVPWQNTPISILATDAAEPSFYIVIDSWTY